MNQGLLPCCKFTKKTTIYNTNKNLANDDMYTKFGLILSICSPLSKNRILKSIKGSNSVANLRKTNIYNSNIDLVNDNVYIKFGLNLFIRSQDIEQKPNSDINQEQTLLQICEKQ